MAGWLQNVETQTNHAIIAIDAKRLLVLRIDLNMVSP